MVEEAYKASIAWGITPDQFWRMYPLEWWWQFDARRVGKQYGFLSEEDMAELYEDMMAANNQRATHA